MSKETQKERTFKTFDDFTNLYEVQKTLRFELKPTEKTKELIELKQNNVLQIDKQIDDNYHSIKYYFDLLHRKFIKEALSDVKLNYEDYERVLLAMDKKDEATRKAFNKEEEFLRKELVKKFDEKANDWKNKYNEEFRGQAASAREGRKKPIQLKSEGIGILFEKDNLEILKFEFQEKPKNDLSAPDIFYTDGKNGQEKNLFESFKGFTTYLTNFNYSRKNFYSEKDQDTAIANRAINENLAIFCNNKKLFQNDKKYQDISFTKEEKVIFDINFYNNYLTQDGIKKYNEIVGRKSQKESEGEKGLNQKINEYNQKNKDNKAQLLKKLYNQILADREGFLREIEITSDDQVFSCLKGFVELNEEKNKKVRVLLEKFFDVRSSYNIEKIYIKKSGLNTLLSKFFGENAEYVKRSLPHKISSSKEEKYKIDDFISIATIKDALLGIQKDKKQLSNKYHYLNKIEMSPMDLFEGEYKDRLIDNNYQSFFNIWKSEFEKCFKECELIKKWIEQMISGEETYKKNEKQIEKIKNYADASLAIYQMMKYFALEKGRKKVETLLADNDFYNEFNDYYQDYPINSYYNEFRNYLTKKDFLGRLLFPAFGEEDNREQKNPLSKRKIDGAEKIKINFGCGNLLSGWAQDYSKPYGGVLFKNSEKYYLGIIKNKIDEDEAKRLKDIVGSKNLGERLVYDYQKPDNKNVPRLFIRSKRNKFSPAVEELKLPVQSIIDIYDKGLFKIDKKNPEAHKKYLVKLIDYFKIGFGKHPSYKSFSFQWKESVKYENIAVFYRDVIDSCYKINYESVNFDYLSDLVSSGKMYLFEIYNKDFGNIKENSKLNIYTYLFIELLKPKNIGVLKLMGGGEIFFRPKVENLPKKKDKNGKEVIDHKRYAEDKYFLHFPINIVGRKLNSYLINKTVNEYLSCKIGNGEIKIIGIDRGEKNLAYYSVIDNKGSIIDSGSFNEIDVLDKDGKVIKIDDYAKKLKKKAGNRDEALKNWKTIENIKELKNGYVSQVIRKICDLILKHNAIVVFEDLNFGFKLKRSAFDFPVYQKLELALIKKLNYLVNKDAKENEAGHCLKAYQLAPMVANPQDIRKQTGIVFYTQASYTSKTCPQCGFRKNNNKFKYFESIKKARNWIGKLEKFEYSEKDKMFVIKYNLDNFLSDDERKKTKKERENELFSKIPKQKEFVVCSDVIRFRWHNKLTSRAKELNIGEEKYFEDGRGVVKKYNITECLKGLLDKNKINYKESLKDFLISDDNNLSPDFYRSLFHYLNLIFEIRNSVSGEEIDYIQCPCPRCGFHSDHPSKELEQIKNADANGAYNIARKGIMILEKIKQIKEREKINSDDLFISIEEWDKFAQKDWKEK